MGTEWLSSRQSLKGMDTMQIIVIILVTLTIMMGHLLAQTSDLLTLLQLISFLNVAGKSAVLQV